MIIEIFADGLDRDHINQEKIHVACRAVVVKDNKVLGEFLKKSDVFNLPGGGLEPKESLEDCVKREVLEETGVVVNVISSTVTVKEYFADETWESHFFRCEEISSHPQKLSLTFSEKNAGLEAKWYDLYEFLGFLESYESNNPYGENIHQRELIGLINSI
jgi:ADP-ribose pyrophosphatase YjhB (NUDIX family)